VIDNRLSSTGFKLSICVSLLFLTMCSRPAAGGKAAAAYRVYATNEISGDLIVIDGATEKVVGIVHLGKRPRGIKVSPDGQFIFVALSGSPIAGPGVDESALPPPDKAADGVGVVSAASLQVLKVLRGVSDPEQLAVSPDGRTLYFASQDANSVMSMDIQSGAIVHSASAGGEPEGIAVSPDGRLLYVSSEEGATVTAFDPVILNRLGQIKVGERPRGIAFSPDSHTAYVTGENDASLTQIDTAKGAVTRTVKAPNAGAKPMGVVVSPDASRVYVATGRAGALVAFDASSLAPMGQVIVGARPWGVAVSPDGALIYTANGQSGDLSVIDAKTLTLKSKIKVQDRPWGVAVGPAPGA
jgi:YVTN family beta-propeller protein